MYRKVEKITSEITDRFSFKTIEVYRIVILGVNLILMKKKTCLSGIFIDFDPGMHYKLISYVRCYSGLK